MSKSFVVKTKSTGNMPRWLVFLMLGLVALVITPYFFTLETAEFDARVERKVAQIRGQIGRGEFREVFLAADRELIAAWDEAEFIGHLAPGREFLAGSYRKTGGGVTRFVDLASRVKRLFGRPYNISTGFMLESDGARANEYFSWKVRGDEIKLAYYELKIAR